MGFRLLRFFLFAAIVAGCYGGEVYTITRRSTGYKPDTFRVPTSMCSVSGSECKSFNKDAFSSGGNCKCGCSYGSSTFGFHNGSWTCLDNIEVREQTDCKFEFSGESDQYPPKVLSVGSTHKAILPSGSCSINFAASGYLNCNGAWTRMKNSSNPLNILDKVFLSDPRKLWEYTLQVGKATSLAGRTVSLHFNCKNPSQSSCLLFKVAGEITCPAFFSRPSSKHHPTSTVKSPLIIRKTFSFKSTGTISTESPVLVSHRGQSGSPSGTVAAVIILVILVIIMAAITGFIIWKRKRGENLWCKNRMTSIVRKIRPSLVTAKDSEDREPDEEIYAEIPDLPTQSQTGRKTDAVTGETYNFGFEDLNSRHGQPDQLDEHFLREEAGSVVLDETFNDEDVHLARSDSPLYITLEEEQTANEGESHNYDNQQQKDVSVSPKEPFTDDDGYLVPIDSPIYIMLKADPVETANEEEIHIYDNPQEKSGVAIPEELVTDDDGYLVPIDSPLYMVLEPREEQTTSTI